jgi:hypothetical protein
MALAGPSDSVTVDVIHPTTDRVSPRHYGVIFSRRRFTSESIDPPHQRRGTRT